MARVLIVDDEKMQRGIMRDILRSEGHSLFEAENAGVAKTILENELIDVVLTDMNMPGESGLNLVEYVAKMDTRAEIVVITAFGTIETAVRAMRKGAYDYLTKPIERDELVLVVQRAMEKFRLRQTAAQWSILALGQAIGNIVAESPAMKQILATVQKVAHSEATVLLRGPSGTGKECIARLIHALGPLKEKPMHSINCAALPESLLESELFGYEKGAFTGANTRKIGIMEAANGSTLLLDEVAEMSPPTQAKILRSIQEKEIRRLGGTENIRVSIRLIAATNKNLEKAVAEGSFREDLFYRLNVIPIIIPPLRDRPEDIGPLVQAVMARRGNPKTIHPRAMNHLKKYHWPGNVRELEAVLERLFILSPNPEILVEDLPPEIQTIHPVKNQSLELPDGGIVFEEWEKRILEQAVVKSKGIMTEAAKLLGMTYRTFQYRAEKFGINKSPDFGN